MVYKGRLDLFELETFLTRGAEAAFARGEAVPDPARDQPDGAQAGKTNSGRPCSTARRATALPTDARTRAHDYAEKLLNMRGEAMTAIEKLRQMNKGKLSVAANEYTCLYLLPVLNVYRRHAPMIKVSILRSLRADSGRAAEPQRGSLDW